MGLQYFQRNQPLGLIFLLCVLMVSCHKELIEWSEQMVTKIKPSFSRGLESISNLLDGVMLYEEDDPPNSAASLAFTISVKHSTQLALDSISEADKICIAYLNQFNDTFIALSVQISESEKEQARSKAKIDQLNAEIKQWEADTEVLGKEVKHLQEKVQESNRKVEQIESQIKQKEKDRTKLIIASIFTFGLAAFGIIGLDQEWNKLANERNGHQASMENRQYHLDKTEKTLRDMSNRQFASREDLEKTKNHLLYLKSSLVRLESQQGETIDFGQRVRKVHIFLAEFKSKLNGIYTQQGVKTLMKALLLSIDDLVEFLGDSKSGELINLIGDKKVVERIREHTEPSDSNNLIDVMPPQFVDPETGEFLDFQPLESWDSESLKFLASFQQSQSNKNKDYRSLTKVLPYEGSHPESTDEIQSEDKKNWFKLFQVMHNNNRVEQTKQ